MGKFLDLLNKKLKIVEKRDYPRPEYNSYMSVPEWRNVEIAEEFAKFLKDGKSIFRYPYFKQVFDIWKAFFNSYLAAKKYNHHKDILTSEYMVMDVFVSFFTTLELLPKGLLSLVLRPYVSKENNTEMQKKLAEYFEQYANDLQTIPFYDQNYAENKRKLAEAFQKAQNKSWTDWLSWGMISKELTARLWVSKPLHKWFHSDENIVTPTTDVIVKMKVPNQENSNPVKQFREKINDMQEQVSIVHDHVYAKKPKANKTYTSVYALLRASRYGAFQETIKKLAEEKIELKKIAGNDHVQVKCETKGEDVLSEHARFLYSYGDGIDPTRKICLFDVPVEKLQETVEDFNSKENVKVKYIHNF